MENGLYRSFTHLEESRISAVKRREGSITNDRNVLKHKRKITQRLFSFWVCHASIQTCNITICHRNSKGISSLLHLNNLSPQIRNHSNLVSLMLFVEAKFPKVDATDSYQIQCLTTTACVEESGSKDHIEGLGCWFLCTIRIHELLLAVQRLLGK